MKESNTSIVGDVYDAIDELLGTTIRTPVKTRTKKLMQTMRGRIYHIHQKYHVRSFLVKEKRWS